MDENTNDKPKKKVGRPSVITDYDKERVINWVGKYYCSINQCAKRLMVDEASLRREMERDPDFRRRVKEAETDAHDGLIAKMLGPEVKDWRAAWTALSAKWPQDWARKMGTYTEEDMLKMALKFSELVKKYVPEDAQMKFSSEVENIITEIDKDKKKNDL